MKIAVCKNCNHSFNFEFGICPQCGTMAMEVTEKDEMTKTIKYKHVRKLPIKNIFKRLIFIVSILIVISGILLFVLGYLEIIDKNKLVGLSLSEVMQMDTDFIIVGVDKNSNYKPFYITRAKYISENNKNNYYEIVLSINEIEEYILDTNSHSDLVPNFVGKNYNDIKSSIVLNEEKYEIKYLKTDLVSNLTVLGMSERPGTLLEVTEKIIVYLALNSESPEEENQSEVVLK